MKKLNVITVIGLLILGMFISCQSDEDIEFKRYYSGGSVVYQNHCQNCHGDKGQGLSALIPPLTDSTYLKANASLLSCKIKNGLKGKLTVGGKFFDGQMPANDLTPIEIAQVLTYITNSFGNKHQTITVDQVNIDLNNCSN